MKAKDWTRPFGWGAAGLALAALAAPIRDHSDPIETVATSLLVGIGYFFLFAIVGVVVTFFRPSPTRTRVPFLTLSTSKSLLFVSAVAGCLGLKTVAYDLGAIGVIGYVGFGVLALVQVSRGRIANPMNV